MFEPPFLKYLNTRTPAVAMRAAAMPATIQYDVTPSAFGPHRCLQRKKQRLGFWSLNWDATDFKTRHSRLTLGKNLVVVSFSLLLLLLILWGRWVLGGGGGGEGKVRVQSKELNELGAGAST